MTTPSNSEVSPPGRRGQEVLPERVGPYDIERKLGAGGMGTVYHGTHRETRQVAAVKVLPASMAREHGFVARFTREIDAMRKLESPHIVRLYDSGVDDGTYYYAMEYVDGETLTDRLKRDKRIPWREAVEIGIQICKALKSAHNSGIIHRDLKPSNLLLARDGSVKLTDFGVAQVFAGGKLTATGGMIGTAEYMSPEQTIGQRATKRSDIYSLGAVLYVMLTGRPPFVGSTAMDIAQKHRFNQFDSPRRIVPEIPHWLDEIVCQCLEKKPDDRFPDAYVLSLRLAEVPRKVDLAKGDATFEFSDQHATAETMSATSARPAEGQEVGGTLMRDLMRAHIEEAHAPTPVQSLFDNTWVLLALLGLLVLGGIVWYQSGQETDEERFARGALLMQGPRGAAWEEARSSIFEPLLANDPEVWGPRVQPYLDRIAAYDTERDLLGSDFRRSPGVERTEVERFLIEALEQRNRGSLAAAEQTLQSLSTLLAGHPDEQQWRRVTDEFLRQVREQQANPEQASSRYALLEAALARAASMQKEGRTEEAAAIWRSTLDLYDDDPGAASLLEQARRQLEESGASQPNRTEPESESHSPSAP